MFHVALVIPTIDQLAGAEIQVLQIANGLRRRGWRVTVISLSGTGGSSAQELITNGIGFLSLRMRKGLCDPRGWSTFRAWINREHPDILHGHLPHAVWMTRCLRLFAPVRVLLDSMHTSQTGTFAHRLAYRVSAWVSDLSIAVSEGAADAWLSAGAVLPERLIVIPNGLDTGRWKADQETRLRIRTDLQIDDKFVWFTAARMEIVKNQRSLIEAMTLVSDSAYLLIAGDGSLRAALEDQSRRLGLGNRVRFLGHTSRVHDWMQAADAFVLPSLREGLPLALLESGACSLPSVAADVPGCRDALIHGETGILAKSPSPGDLAIAMHAMMEVESSQRMLWGLSARRHVVSHFEMEGVLDRWEDLYGELLRLRPELSRFAIAIS